MLTKPKPKTHHAIKSDPLREPGQSLRDELEKLIDDDAMMWLILAVIAGVWTLYEWFRWIFDTGFHPFAMTVVAVPFIAYVVYRIRKLRPQLDRLRKGIRGEQLAGQFLQNELLPMGYRVFHDLVEDGYNIDHVAVGPKGVLAIETKAFSKSIDGASAIVIDGEEMMVNGHKPDRNPIQQAEAIADRVKQILPSLRHGPVTVQPVVLVGGWQVTRRSRPQRTWVVNFTGLGRFLDHEPETLTDSDIQYLSTALEERQRRKA